MARGTWIPRGVPGNERILAFSDGVFAIAITLLVLELKVPEHLPHDGLLGLLPTLLPKYLGHVVSFVVLGVYWVGHHNMFRHIPRHDRVLLWLNLMFLMFVASMPFFAGLVMHHGGDSFALALYAGNLAAVGFSQELVWWYASAGNRLLDEVMDPDLVAFVHRRILVAPVLFLVAIPLAYLQPQVAMALGVIIPLIYIFPNPLDRYHHRQLNPGGATEK